MELTIEKLIYGGEGLAHHDGSTVFIPFVLPAERVSAAAVEQKKKFVRARVERVLEPSPERASARCPHFGVCGGCDYQHIPYDAQLKYKTEILRETLRRLGRIEWLGEIVAHASPPWGYRNRAQWKIRPLSEEDGAALGIGYFRASSTALCAVDDCAILSPLLLKTLLALRGALAAGQLPRELREIEAFAGANDSKLLLTATFAGLPSHSEELAKTFRGILPAIESLLFHDPGRERMKLDGPGFVECEAAGNAYRVGHFSFFQVNRFLAGDLVREVAGNEEVGRLVLDLFAGVGLFSVPLAAQFARVVAVESNPAAARDLETNTSGRAARSGRSIEVHTADVEQFLQNCRETPDLVVADPPRVGLTPTAIKHLARIAPARITYVSCEPPTLARDLAALLKAGYEISDMHLFDLFPQTFHMEAVARLRRRP
ncbi:MAG TPA: 23S rRNA (uracil(1939)-C(5))-methyltransferase RlmD [Candidatus Acidoferrales bacterium]|nr:23S rRNA (uracil(1939)-C(5))-methyltransferase RlmD [Candidatus Acidoferrales bacterium]